MALLGVLLGVSMAVLGWGLYEVREQKKLIIDLQNRVIFDVGERISALERRKTVTEDVVHKSAAAAFRRQWSEDTPAKDSN